MKESKLSLIAIKLSLPQTSGSRSVEGLESTRRPLVPPHAEREADSDMSPSVRMIIELNIGRYREILKTESDQSKRRTIVQLLAEEEAKLAKLSSEEEH
jgi:hypothetical protein